MWKTLAIKGHPTRGKEVIELLGMMGGEAIAAKGDEETAIYVIPNNGIIDIRYTYEKRIDNYAIFTLEEFWKKYPFKIGDKIIDLKSGKIAEVYKMHWSENNSCVYYDIKYLNNLGCQRRVMDLQPYKEEINMIDNKVKGYCTKTPEKHNETKKIAWFTFWDNDFADKVELDLKDRELIHENGKWFAVKKKSKYPKTYEECCKNYPDNEKLKIGNLLCDLEQLIICRNAYWKIAGEEMGIDKPWEPDWMDETTKYGIGINRNFVFKDDVIYARRILVFPTKEIRDAFYDNFKELIEQCKELL